MTESIKNVIGIRFIFFMILLCGTVFQSGIALAQDVRIFILHSYHQEYPWTKNENKGFIQTLINEFPTDNINFSTEYLDTKRVNFSKEYQDFFYKYLKKKFEHYLPDVIFCSDDNGLTFLLQFKEKLFGNVPVVFCGVNNLNVEKKLNRQQYIGVFEKKEVTPNLALLKKINPQPSNIIFIGDVSSTQHAIEQKIRNDIAAHFPQQNYTILTNNNLSHILKKLRSHKEGVIFLTTIGGIKDEQGKIVPLQKTISSIAQTGNFTILSMEDVYLEEGVLGGYVTSGFSQGKEAAHLTMQILQGNAPSSIPLVKESPNEFMFNYPQLKRFGLTTSQLPEKSIILNRPQSFYDQYKYKIWSAGLFLIFQTFVIVILIQNIRHRKKAETSLQKARDELEHRVEQRTRELGESEEKYRQLVEGTDDLITRVDSEGKFIFANNAAEKYFGRKAEMCIDRSAFDFVYKDDLKKTKLEFERCLKEKKKKAFFENRQIGKDGEIHHMIWDSTFTYDSDDNIVSVDGIGRDITRLRETEIILQKEKERAQKYLDIAGAMLMALDSRGRITLINQKGCNILEVTEQEALGQNWFDHYLPEYMRKEIWGVFEKLMQKDIAPVEHYENKILTKNQEERIIAFHNSILTDKEGTIEGVLFSGEDITDRKKNEEEKAHLESQLRQAQKMEAIGTLAGGIAHDFNNILAAILGYAEIVSDELTEDSPAKRDIQEVLKAGRRAKKLVQHILAFSRESEKERFPVEIHLIAAEALKLLRASIPTTIEIQQDIDSSCGHVLADSTQMYQVIMNLCTNAAQAMDEKGGILGISLSGLELTEEELRNNPLLQPGQYIQLTVSDTGPGIDKDTIDRIFDPYFTTKDIGKGSGMGLAVVHGIVKSHDGMITVESKLGSGTTFNVFFQRVEEVLQEETKEKTPLPAGNERILVIDDEESVAEMTKRSLERLGYQVTATTESTKALELFRSRSNDFDLVITDQTMPNMTGEVLANELKSINSNIPIVLCTGYSARIDAEKAKLLGINAYMMKPIAIRELAHTLRQVFDGEDTVKQ